MLREIEEVIEVSEELLKKINWAKNFSGGRRYKSKKVN